MNIHNNQLYSQLYYYTDIKGITSLTKQAEESDYELYFREELGINTIDPKTMKRRLQVDLMVLNVITRLFGGPLIADSFLNKRAIPI